MPIIKLTSFNCENLMMRFNFRDTGISDLRNKLTSISEAAVADSVDAAFDVLSEDDRTLTAQTLAAGAADICALQEVENLVVLTAFHNRYVRRWTRRGYAHRILKEGNDARGIDVAALSRATPQRVISHAETTLSDLGISPRADQSPHDPVFRRDCLQLDYRFGETRLAVFVCHFKSMHGGRYETRHIRQQEALGVRRIIEQSFETPETENWIICGDFNDYLEQDGVPANDHALSSLIDDGFSVDALMASDIPAMERWTHHYAPENSYAALDHIFLSPALAARNARPMVSITRMGLSWRAQRYQGMRLPGVGWSHPKASDHCPIRLEFLL